ncbi:Gfo/Idh/MocA family protein [Aureimonas pseudogalii]|uniref:Putative dehydrogenase n=1 Tax=Aureimonas pseudogalii TaxID=1744844 RepID=A0A7W6H7X0_9HYPH|nr:Gfo/Idh/MocA family oxidoreductase [Aureimonas pseudogalii]MBB4000216.1 putative dehydrogenase [Aureimonas pseudogalii]
MKPVGIGIIGCGNISAAYLKAARSFPILDIRALSDARPEAAEARAAEFGGVARSVAEILADPEIEIVLNLTIPAAHVDVGLQIIEAGKHAYSEKPLGIDYRDARRLSDAAAAKGLRLGSAPDTFLGGAHQAARAFVDAGHLGQPIGGTAFFMCPGHERWHPDPGFYYKRGGGPMLDMGPYYITDLVNLLGPVARVAGLSPEPRRARTIASEPKKGETIEVEVPTHVAGAIQFANGAVVTMAMSFDVAAHRHLPLEIYGTEGSLVVPDPNYFGGEVSFRAKGDTDWSPVEVTLPYADGNHRSLGLADMAAAIRADRPHRASGELALHVLEVMEAFGRSSETGRFVEIETAPGRPAPLSADAPLDRL